MGTNGNGVGHNFTSESIVDEQIATAIKNRRKNSKIENILEALVVPNSVQEIVLVVYTVAKANA